MRPHDDDDIDTDVTEFIEAMDRALTVHEAGHAVVAHKLGAHVVFVEIDLQTGNGGLDQATSPIRSKTSRSASRDAGPNTYSVRAR